MALIDLDPADSYSDKTSSVYTLLIPLAGSQKDRFARVVEIIQIALLVAVFLDEEGVGSRGDDLYSSPKYNGLPGSDAPRETVQSVCLLRCEMIFDERQERDRGLTDC